MPMQISPHPINLVYNALVAKFEEEGSIVFIQSGSESELVARFNLSLKVHI